MKSIKIAFIRPHEPVIVGSPEKITEYIEGFFDIKLKEIAEFTDDDILSFEKEDFQEILNHVKDAIQEISYLSLDKYEFNLSTSCSERNDVFVIRRAIIEI